MKKQGISLLLAGLLLLAGCGAAAPEPRPSEAAVPTTPAASAPSSPAESAAVAFTDDLGREVTVEPPERVAVMLGSFADVWCLAGGKDLLVAAPNDAWASFELGLSGAVADIGSLLDPNLEVLLAARPELVLASANNKSHLGLQDTLEQAGIAVAFFDVQHFDDYLHMLEICTRLTGCGENLEQYGTAVQSRVEAAKARQDGSAPKVVCIRFAGSSVKIKGSTDFLLGEMLSDLGCVNIADSDASIIDSLSLEAIIAGDPDYIFAVPQGSDLEAARAALEEALLSNPAWANLRAVRDNRFFILDKALYNLKPNARWGEAYEKLADILYPGT